MDAVTLGDVHEMKARREFHASSMQHLDFTAVNNTAVNHPAIHVFPMHLLSPTSDCFADAETRFLALFVRILLGAMPENHSVSGSLCFIHLPGNSNSTQRANDTTQHHSKAPKRTGLYGDNDGRYLLRHRPLTIPTCLVCIIL